MKLIWVIIALYILDLVNWRIDAPLYSRNAASLHDVSGEDGRTLARSARWWFKFAGGNDALDLAEQKDLLRHCSAYWRTIQPTVLIEVNKSINRQNPYDIKITLVLRGFDLQNISSKIYEYGWVYWYLT